MPHCSSPAPRPPPLLPRSPGVPARPYPETRPHRCPLSEAPSPPHRYRVAPPPAPCHAAQERGSTHAPPRRTRWCTPSGGYCAGWYWSVARTPPTAGGPHSAGECRQWFRARPWDGARSRRSPARRRLPHESPASASRRRTTQTPREPGRRRGPARGRRRTRQPRSRRCGCRTWAGEIHPHRQPARGSRSERPRARSAAVPRHSPPRHGPNRLLRTRDTSAVRWLPRSDTRPTRREIRPPEWWRQTCRTPTRSAPCRGRCRHDRTRRSSAAPSGPGSA